MTMTEPRPLTQSERNARIVRAGLCWDCIVKTTRKVDGWDACPECDRRWRVLNRTTILERNPLPAEIYGKHARLLPLGSKVVWDPDRLSIGHRMVETTDDAWLIPINSYVEGLWTTS